MSNMTLDEAITHAKASADECTSCGREHEQLAKWLEELKRYKSSKVLKVKLELEGIQELQDVLQDAKRYRWLRAQFWHDSELCVVHKPKESLKLGSFAPCGDLLDAEIDRCLEG